MKTLFPLILACIFLSACEPYFYPISGKYSDHLSTSRMISINNRDEVWTRIMLFFAVNNISPMVVDKGAGIAKSDLISFRNYAHGERLKHDHPEVGIKYVVSERIQDAGEDTVRFPNFIDGRIEIFAIPYHDSIDIQVKLDDLKSYDIYPIRSYRGGINYENHFYGIQSLGVLEKEMVDYLINEKQMPRVEMPQTVQRIVNHSN